MKLDQKTSNKKCKASIRNRERVFDESVRHLPLAIPRPLFNASVWTDCSCASVCVPLCPLRSVGETLHVCLSIFALLCVRSLALFPVFNLRMVCFSCLFVHDNSLDSSHLSPPSKRRNAFNSFSCLPPMGAWGHEHRQARSVRCLDKPVRRGGIEEKLHVKGKSDALGLGKETFVLSRETERKKETKSENGLHD